MLSNGQCLGRPGAESACPHGACTRPPPGCRGPPAPSRGLCGCPRDAAEETPDEGERFAMLNARTHLGILAVVGQHLESVLG